MIEKASSLPEQSPYRSMGNRKGGILIISLWSLCLLTFFAVSLSYGIRQKIILVQRLEERYKLHFIAEAGVKKAISKLMTETGEAEERTYDSLSDGWSNNAGAFKDIKVGDGIFNVCYSYTDEFSGITAIQYGLVDEERKININKADQVILENLFRIVLDFSETESQDMAASIVDWRDGDSEVSMPSGSAEDSYYESLPYPYEAKDGEFELLDEMLLVKGVTSPVFRKLRDYVTIYGEGKININTASREALLALGLESNIVDDIISFRQGKDGIMGSDDDSAFKEHSEIVPKFSQSFPLSEAELAEFSRVVNSSLTTKSDNFMIRSVARLSYGDNTSEIFSVVTRTGDILYWQEY